MRRPSSPEPLRTHVDMQDPQLLADHLARVRRLQADYRRRLLACSPSQPNLRAQLRTWVRGAGELADELRDRLEALRPRRRPA